MFLTCRRLTLRGVRLGAVSHCDESDSAQYHTAQSPTPRSVRQFWIFRHFNLNFPTRRSVILCGVRLGAVWYCAESDLEQYHTTQSHVFSEYLRKNEFFSETILDCLSGTQTRESWHWFFKSWPERLCEGIQYRSISSKDELVSIPK